MKEKKIRRSLSAGLAFVLAFSLLLSSGSLNRVSAAEAGNLVANAGFENGLEGWQAGDSGKFARSTEQFRTGEASLKITSTSQDWNSFASDAIPVLPDTDYTLTFYGKGGGNAVYKVLSGDWSESLAEGTTNNTESDWTKMTKSFNTGSRSAIVIYLSDSASDAFFDDFSLTKTPAVPSNGDFESGDLTNWNAGTSTKFAVTRADKHSGEYALKVTSASQDWNSLTTALPVQADTNYTLSFYGKGSGNAWMKVLTSDWSQTLAEKGTENAPAEWTKQEMKFNSGANTNLVFYMSDTPSDAYYDDFALTKTQTAPSAEVEPLNGRPAIGTDGFDLNPVDLVDGGATAETRSLYAYLKNTAGRYMMFGHQNDITESVVKNAPGGSDTYGAVGAYPAVIGLGMSTDTARLIEAAQSIHAKNGIVTIEDHMPNFTSGGSFGDMTPTVEHILPGGKDNAKFLKRLDALAEVAKGAVDADGKPIPIIYRPFHENSGMWFWWGASNTTKSEFVHLWRYTVEYLRDVKGVDNLLYAYSPNGHFTDETDYLSRYPGDDYVDILGFDMYNDNPQYGSGWMEATLQDARIAAGLAEARGKVAAFTEAGLRWDGANGLKLSGNTMPDWYMVLHDTLTKDPVAKKIAYMMTWRNEYPGDGNAPTHFWVPFRDHPVYGNHEMLFDFVKFYNLDDVLFADRLAGQYGLRVEGTQKKPSGYLMAPGTKETVKGIYGLKTKVHNYGVDVASVRFEPGQSKNPLTGTLTPDGYYTASWDTTKQADGPAAVKTVITLADGTTISDQANVVVRNTDATAGDSALVDDFESYAGDSALLREAWLRNGNGDMNTLTLDPSPFGSAQGSAMKFVYNLGASGYTGAAKTLNADWSGGKGVELWFKGDGLKQDVLFQLSSGSGSFEAHLNDFAPFDRNSTEPQKLTIPFDRFKPKNGGVLNPADIKAFAIYVNAVNGAKVSNSALYLDDIRKYADPAVPGNGNGTGSENGSGNGSAAGGTNGNSAAPTEGVNGAGSGPAVTPTKLENGMVIAEQGSAQQSVVVDLAQIEGRPLQIRAQQVSVTVRPSVIQSLIRAAGGAKDAVIIVETGPEAAVPTLSGEQKLAGPLLDVTVTLRTKNGSRYAAEQVNGGVELAMSYEQSADPELLGIYGYDRKSGEWEYIGGTADAASRTISAALNHLSPYAVLQYDKTFRDVPENHWSSRALKVLAAKHAISGIDEDRFVPSEAITRAEFVAMLARTFKLPAVEAAEVSYEDFDPDAWYAEVMTAAAGAGWIVGDPGKRLQPNKVITRAEMAVILGRALKLGAEREGTSAAFTDAAKIPRWAIPSAAAAQAAGLMQGTGEGRFAPERSATRSEAAMVVYHALTRR
ncbi:glycosyl hydrolase [Saccharibacillus sp. O23]|uniref:glycosyl hydrolase n=1 Tax=Saccharibacillus sp. O23 TaxID=2009338 RepID=UPI0015C5C0E9|nr:glycosyl hydrolase [Saccharibacillus sp. O23]